MPSRRFGAVPAALLAAFAVLAAGTVFAVDLPQPGGPPNDPQFEVDGDKVAAVAGNLDWDAANAARLTFPGTAVVEAVRNADGTCTQGNAVALGGPGDPGTGVLICDGSAGNFADQNTFTQGSKEENPPDATSTTTEWVIKPQGNPKKGDLAEIYAYAKRGDSAFDADAEPDDLFLFADVTRLDVNGSTHADFEFNRLAQDDCADTDPTTFCQTRSDGDIIMAFDLEQGGNDPQVRLLEFKTTLGIGEVCASAPQVTAPPGCYVNVTATTPIGPGGEPAQLGVLNTVEVDAPSWRSVGCEKTSDDPSAGCKLRNRIPAKGDMEGYVDLTAFLGDDFPLCPGFGQLTVKTRASDSLSAELKDTTPPVPITVSVCGSVIVRKFDDDGAPLPGAGFTFSPSPSLAGGAPVEVKDGSLADHADANDGVVCLDGVLFPQTYTVTETTVPPGFFGDPDAETVVVSDPSTCAERLANGDTDATFTNVRIRPAIRVTKTCTAAVNTAGTGVNVAFSGEVCNQGNVVLTGVGVSDDKGTVTQQPAATLAPGVCSPYRGSYTSTTADNTDTVTARGTGGFGSGAVSDTDTATCRATLSPAIRVTKTCTATVNQAGTAVDVGFSGQVCNDGNVALTGVSVSNDKGGVTNQPASTLAPGACSSYGGTYTSATAANTDTVTASATGAVGAGTVTDTDTASCTATVTPRISVTKECRTLLVLDPETNKLTVRVEFGGQVCARNARGDSNVQLSGVSVVETHAGQTQTVLSDVTLAPGACRSYTGGFFPTSLAGSAGTSSDTATARGTGALGAGPVQTSDVPASCNLCPLPE